MSIKAILDGQTYNNVTKISASDGSTTKQISLVEDSSGVTYETPTINVSETGLITATANGKSGTKQLTTHAGGKVTPTTQYQTSVVPKGVFTTGVTGVDSIPGQYIIPSGSKTITANGTNIDVKNFATVNVNVPTSGGTVVSGAIASDIISGVSALASSSARIEISGLQGKPIAFALMRNKSVAMNTRHIISVSAFGDAVYGTAVYEQNTYNSAYNYNHSDGYSYGYSNGTLTITSSDKTTRGQFATDGGYDLLYLYEVTP